MKIRLIVAKNIGFCFGVRRSVETVEKLLESERKVYVAGELVHNERVLNELMKKGMVLFNPHSDLPKDLKAHTVVVRAHGLPPNIVKRLEDHAGRVVDTTCPIVMDMFKTAKGLAKKHDRLYVLGDPNHPEIVALRGYVEDPIVFKDRNELEKILKMRNDNPNLKVALISQTTKDFMTFQRSLELLVKHFKCVSVNRTICDITIKREEELGELSKKSDVVMVIGSEKSSNTNKLLRIARENTKAFLVSDPHDLRRRIPEFSDGMVVSMVSGTSTPDQLVDEMIDELKKICEEVDVVWSR
ncbi:MAG TPA: 4-hydroxy-3-methylbut-2-enyl diphosphate reductase [Thermotogales bacterium]|nr:4-hydroxy-3-methylbut-2-enyl diphosphate reductase [Thermotogales bacterium]